MYFGLYRVPALMTPRLALLVTAIIAASGCGGRAAQRAADGGRDSDTSDAHASLDRGANLEAGGAGKGGLVGSGGNGGANGRDGGSGPSVVDGSTESGTDSGLGRDGAPARDASPAVDASSDGGRPSLDAALDIATGDSGCGSLDDPHHCGACNRDCTSLPNVNGDYVSCVARACTFTSLSCRLGFADCNLNAIDGCETDLSRPENCGRCGRGCPGVEPTCALTSRGTGVCGVKCSAPLPDACGALCTDFNTDSLNCGSCQASCGTGENVLSGASCVAGKCTGAVCLPGWADCDGVPGCETSLDTEQSCGACGAKPACALANVQSMCVVGGPPCSDALCVAGYGNCDPTSSDCEAAWGTAAGSCLPHFLGAVAAVYEDLAYGATAVAADGAFYVGGSFSGTANFDPTGGTDLQRSLRDDQGQLSNDVFVTRINADGSYAWTRTFGGPGSDGLVGLAVGPDGSVVIMGNFDTGIDLDPGPALDLRPAAGPGVPGIYLLKLGSDGLRVWGDTWSGTNVNQDGQVTPSALSADTDGNLYVSGSTYQLATFDFDPSAGVSNQAVGDNSSFLMKVNAMGGLAWADVIGGTACSSGIGKVAVNTGGTVWATGSFDGICDLDPGSGVVSRTLSMATGVVLELSATGAYLGDSMIGGGTGTVQLNDIAASSQGALYIGGAFTGTVDFDPGPGIASRTGNQAGFLLTLMPDGKFDWVKKLADGAAYAVFGGPGGGVFYSGAPLDATTGEYISTVTMLRADGGAAWTLAPGSSSTSVTGVGLGPMGFVIAGSDSSGSDLDPGPAVYTLPGPAAFALRYAF